MIKIVFLNSGGGGNLKFIHEVAQVCQDIEIVGVLANKECGATEYAIQNDIKTFLHKFDKSKIDDDYILKNLRELNPDIVITNIHKILSSYLLSKCNFRLINLHYSLLPAYAGFIGMNPLKSALMRKNSVLGCTVHLVSELVDEGETICQGIFFRRATYKENEELMFKCGALTLLNSIFFQENEKDYWFDFNCFLVPGYYQLDLDLPDIFEKISK